MADAPDHPARFPSDRRERAKAMAAAGIFGGAGRGQGRKPKDRPVSEQIAELAQRETPAIRRAFSEGLRDPNPRTRLMSAQALLAEERRERERKEREAMLRALPPDDLDAMLIDILGESLGLDLSAFAPEIVDADIVGDGITGELDEHT